MLQRIHYRILNHLPQRTRKGSIGDKLRHVFVLVFLLWYFYYGMVSKWCITLYTQYISLLRIVIQLWYFYYDISTCTTCIMVSKQCITLLHIRSVKVLIIIIWHIIIYHTIEYHSRKNRTNTMEYHQSAAPPRELQN